MGGVNDAGQRFSGLSGAGQHDHEVGGQRAIVGLGHGFAGAVVQHAPADGLDGELGDRQASIDGGVPRASQMGSVGARCSFDLVAQLVTHLQARPRES